MQAFFQPLHLLTDCRLGQIYALCGTLHGTLLDDGDETAQEFGRDVDRARRRWGTSAHAAPMSVVVRTNPSMAGGGLKRGKKAFLLRFNVEYE